MYLSEDRGAKFRSLVSWHWPFIAQYEIDIDVIAIVFVAVFAVV
jgi:hypothetical protein